MSETLDQQMEDISERAQRLRELIVGICLAEEELDHAKRKVPDYTGQHEPSHYYERQEADCRRLANELENLIFGDVHD